MTDALKPGVGFTMVILVLCPGCKADDSPLKGYLHFFPLFSAFDQKKPGMFSEPPEADAQCDFCHRRYRAKLTLPLERSTPEYQQALDDMRCAVDLASKLASTLYRVEVQSVE